MILIAPGVKMIQSHWKWHRKYQVPYFNTEDLKYLASI